MSEDEEGKMDGVFTKEKQSRVSDGQGIWRCLGIYSQTIWKNPQASSKQNSEVTGLLLFMICTNMSHYAFNKVTAYHL